MSANTTSIALHAGLLSLALLLVSPLPTGAAPPPRVEVCHVDGEGSFHTLSIPETALDAHLDNHGDGDGSCDETCEALCDDGDACTVDCDVDSGSCYAEGYQPDVDCDDGDPNTADSCSSTSGCINTPIVTETCNSLTVTGSCRITTDGITTTGLCVGTDGDDIIEVLTSDAVVSAGDGDDIIKPASSSVLDMTVCGDAGDDTIYDGCGADYLDGGTYDTDGDRLYDTGGPLDYAINFNRMRTLYPLCS